MIDGYTWLHDSVDVLHFTMNPDGSIPVVFDYFFVCELFDVVSIRHFFHFCLCFSWCVCTPCRRHHPPLLQLLCIVPKHSYPLDLSLPTLWSSSNGLFSSLVMSSIRDFNPFSSLLIQISLYRMLCSDYFSTDKPEGRMRPLCVGPSLWCCAVKIRACRLRCVFDLPCVFLFVDLLSSSGWVCHAPQALFGTCPFYTSFTLWYFCCFVSVWMIPFSIHMWWCDQCECVPILPTAGPQNLFRIKFMF